MLLYSTCCFFLLFIILFLLVFLTSSPSIMISGKIIMMSHSMNLEIYFSTWNMFFLLVVFFVAMMVMFFSTSYMSHYNVYYFIMMYMSFVWSMTWLIINSNFYWLMLGWDGLGVVSFLLILFYGNHESVTNALFTIFQNRFGDLFFVCFLVFNLDLYSYQIYSSLGFSLTILLGSMVKSAQFPFNSWLLSAMSAPTPISSLVHSSTLVVAGVYILLQYSYCLSSYLFLLKWISIFTLVISTFGLLNETDMKKLIAFSTMNHVGLMMFLLSCSLYKIAYFHLNIHAMFKSLMFMCFGYVMLSCSHSQDKRLISLHYVNPMVKVVYYYACLCLVGLPFLTGFFSKDFIIEKLFEFSFDFLTVLLLLLFLAASSFYVWKLMSLVGTRFSMAYNNNEGLSLASLMFSVIISVVFVNILVSYVFSISLEYLSFKIFIYYLMLMFLLCSLLKNLHFKLISMDKLVFMKEVYLINFQKLDQFFFYQVFYFMNKLYSLQSMKKILVMNWWVLILLIFMW